jgi:protein FAM32A
MSKVEVIGGKLKLKGDSKKRSIEAITSSSKNEESKKKTSSITGLTGEKYVFLPYYESYTLILSHIDVTGIDQSSSSSSQDDKAINSSSSKKSSETYLTEAQRRHRLKKAELMKSRDLKKLGSTSYRERLESFNTRLASTTEHNDIPRISAAGNG